MGHLGSLSHQAKLLVFGQKESSLKAAWMWLGGAQPSQRLPEDNSTESKIWKRGWGWSMFEFAFKRIICLSISHESDGGDASLNFADTPLNNRSSTGYTIRTTKMSRLCHAHRLCFFEPILSLDIIAHWPRCTPKSYTEKHTTECIQIPPIRLSRYTLPANPLFWWIMCHNFAYKKIRRLTIYTFISDICRCTIAFLLVHQRGYSYYIKIIRVWAE